MLAFSEYYLINSASFKLPPDSKSNCWMAQERSTGKTLEVLARGTIRFIRGGSTPRSSPFPFIIYRFWKKRYPFRTPSLDKWYRLHIPNLELYILFNCYKCTVFNKVLKNHKTRTFSKLFHGHKINPSVALLGHYIDQNTWEIALPFHILQLVKSPPLHIPEG